MAVVEITLTAEQLAAAYLQLSAPERRNFLETVFSHPANHHLALELLMEAHAVLQQKFPPAKQRLLDQLLSKNTEGILRPSEHKQLEALMAEYEAGLVEKARARYIVELSRHAAADDKGYGVLAIPRQADGSDFSTHAATGGGSTFAGAIMASRS